ncbi:MAG: lysophospholipase [Candidatus Liberibacter ctenarytainae]|uniref:Lysophospholipase n=1 Tax=Candidatus Liberibacter ctenarytainae TaxID=2020335 RepID=A0A937AFL9_9HYPH|nr:lysophospholipase [Candidatus Liberibacter ctenarytainae]
MSTKMLSLEAKNLVNLDKPTQKNPRAAVLICQSVEENIEDYDSFRQYLEEADLAVYIYSYHDTKTTKDSPQEDCNSDPNISTIIQDVMELRTSISTNHGNIPVLLFGYSFGTIIALSTLINFPQKFSGIVLWNLGPSLERYSCLLTTFILKAEKFFKGSDTPSRFMRQMTSDLQNHENQNRQIFCKDSPSNPTESANNRKCYDHQLNIPVSIWLELMSMATEINSRGSFSSLSRSTSFCLIDGGNTMTATLDYSQTHNLANRLQKEEFYDISLMAFPPIQPHLLHPKNPFRAMESLRRWIVESYLPQVIPLISHDKNSSDDNLNNLHHI